MKKTQQNKGLTISQLVTGNYYTFLYPNTGVITINKYSRGKHPVIVIQDQKNVSFHMNGFNGKRATILMASYLERNSLRDSIINGSLNCNEKMLINSLLNKYNMKTESKEIKTIKSKKDLIKGEIYVFGDIFVSRIGDIKKTGFIDKWISSVNYHSQSAAGSLLNVREATHEEKHHLNECIRLNKFISREDSLKTFKAEESKANITKFINKGKDIGMKPIEAVDSEGSIFKIGDTVRKPKTKQILTISGFYYNDKKEVIVTTNMFRININSIEHYIDEQEFVLPEKWCIRNNHESIGVYFSKKTRMSYQLYNTRPHKNKYLHSIDKQGNDIKSEKFQPSISSLTIRKDYTEITFEQFKKYVLKDEI